MTISGFLAVHEKINPLVEVRKGIVKNDNKNNSFWYD